MERISLPSYDIVIGEDLQEHIVNFCQKLNNPVAIISDSTVSPLHAQPLQNKLGAYLYTFPAGEISKTRETKQYLEDQMLKDGLGRDTTLLAVGGGVVTDLAGFVASTYCRGIPLVMVPTSLLAMIDAGIGGKTGVNVSQGKNLIGTIYRPQAVFIDVKTLKTLPQKEWDNGLVEMIKHGVTASKTLFEKMERNCNPIETIAENCRVKCHVVEEDEIEQGKRRILNFGHTIGHAIEKLTSYQVPHGQAVALGAIVESEISRQMGYLSQPEFHRIKKVFGRYCPSKVDVAKDEIIQVIAMDKKAMKGVPRFVIVDQIGSTLKCGGDYCQPVHENVIRKCLENVFHDLYRH